MKLKVWSVQEFYCRANGSDMGSTPTGEYFKDHDAGFNYVKEKYGVSNPDSPYFPYFIQLTELHIIDW